MSDFHPEIDPKLRAFIERQPMFFVATAAREGRVNLSPKGLGTFRVLGPRRVAYLDVTGSGNETAAHLLDTNRITFMFNAFDGPAMILRLYGTARSVKPGEGDWPALAAQFEILPGTRQIFVAEIDSVQTSCGYGVPQMQFKTQRETLPKWAAGKGADGLAAYQAENNLESIDGLPTGLDPRVHGLAPDASRTVVE